MIVSTNPIFILFSFKRFCIQLLIKKIISLNLFETQTNNDNIMPQCIKNENPGYVYDLSCKS